MLKEQVKKKLLQLKMPLKDVVGYVQPGPNATNFNEFICPICQLLVLEPVQCKHCQLSLMCRQCLNTTPIIACLKCKKTDRFREPTRDLQKLLDDLDVVCKGPKGTGGCSLNNVSMKYSKLVKSHASTCRGLLFNCPLGCGQSLQSEQQIEQHFKNECPNGLIQCKVCEAVLKRCETSQHSCLESMRKQILDVEDKINNF